MRESLWAVIIPGWTWCLSAETSFTIRGETDRMVERSDRAPLLDWEEVPSAEKDRLSSPSNSRALSGSSSPGFGWSSGPGGPTPSADGCSAPPATSSTPSAAAAAGTDEPLHPDKEEHPSDSGPREVPLEDRMVKWEEKDQIVSVFVVTFNTRSGGT